ncbi:hypothetical protein ACVGOW_08990 [Pseudonocardia saturnea]
MGIHDEHSDLSRVWAQNMVYGISRKVEAAQIDFVVESGSQRLGLPGARSYEEVAFLEERVGILRQVLSFDSDRYKQEVSLQWANSIRSI